MTREEMALLRRRMSGYDRRLRRIWISCTAFAACFQIPGIGIGFMISWQRGLVSIVQSVTVLILAMGATTLYALKLRRMARASMISSAIIRTINQPGEDDPSPRMGADGENGFFLNLVSLRMKILAWGTPEANWKDGSDPSHGHPDDRRRRLFEMLTIAAWRNLPGIPWFVREEMIALAQICIAAEAIQSRSLTGRLRNLWLRVFARRAADRPVGHIVPIEGATT